MLPHSNPQPYPQYSFKENKTWVNKIKKEEKNDKTDQLSVCHPKHDALHTQKYRKVFTKPWMLWSQIKKINTK